MKAGRAIMKQGVMMKAGRVIMKAGEADQGD
jgi:hypothetical protein